MKAIKHINAIAISLPFVILLSYPFIEEGAFIFSLLSTMITGFLQVCIAFKMLYDGKCDNSMYIYFAGVTVFFILWYSFPNTNYTFIIFSLPLILAIYLSVLIHSKKQNTEN